MRVDAIMTRSVESVSPDTPVLEVLERLRARAYGALPVVEPDGRLVGLITETDLLRRSEPVHVPAALSILGELLILENPRALLDELRHKAGAFARDVMSRDLVVVEPDTPVAEAARRLREHRLKRLPVVLDDRLVGIVTQKDLLAALQ